MARETKAERAERLARALKANLARRKEAARATAEPETDDDAVAGGGPEREPG